MNLMRDMQRAYSAHLSTFVGLTHDQRTIDSFCMIRLDLDDVIPIDRCLLTWCLLKRRLPTRLCIFHQWSSRWTRPCLIPTYAYKLVWWARCSHIQLALACVRFVSNIWCSTSVHDTIDIDEKLGPMRLACCWRQRTTHETLHIRTSRYRHLPGISMMQWTVIINCSHECQHRQVWLMRIWRQDNSRLSSLGSHSCPNRQCRYETPTWMVVAQRKCS